MHDLDAACQQALSIMRKEVSTYLVQRRQVTNYLTGQVLKRNPMFNPQMVKRLVQRRLDAI